MGLVVKDDGWRLSDALWSKIEPLLPVHQPRRHPLGCHRPRVDNRAAMNAIVFVLRTGCQWNALNGTGICSSSSAHRRFLEWTEAGVFERLWREGLLAYDKEKGLGWAWLAMDGAMTKAPLAGSKKQAKTRRTVANKGSRGASSPRPRASRSRAWSTARTATT